MNSPRPLSKVTSVLLMSIGDCLFPVLHIPDQLEGPKYGKKIHTGLGLSRLRGNKLLQNEHITRPSASLCKDVVKCYSRTDYLCVLLPSIISVIFFIFIAFILIDLFSSPQPLYELLPNTKTPHHGLWYVFG